MALSLSPVNIYGFHVPFRSVMPQKDTDSGTRGEPLTSRATLGEWPHLSEGLCYHFHGEYGGVHPS